MNDHKPPKKTRCVEKAMNILGNKWTALIIRCLADDAKRYSQIQQSTPHINPRTLSKRLEELTSAGILKSCSDGSLSHAHRCYALTDKGRDLLPIIDEMAKWGEKHPCNNIDPRRNIA